MTPTAVGQTQPVFPPVMDSGVAPRDSGPGAAVDAGQPDAGSVDAARDAGSTADAGQALCPALDAPTPVSDAPSNVWSLPTTLPFSCAPLPNAFFFRPPSSSAGGEYARCASFADARALSLAISPDGKRVALLGTDGVARIVDVASRMVVGVLQPSRASMGLAAFSPDGQTIVTFARGERQVSLWRADTFAPIWTATLPGHTYTYEYTRDITFSPDGTTVLLAVDGALNLLDAATGAIRTTSPVGNGIVVSAAYGWNGRRIAVVTSRLSGMCVYSPVGGAVTVLDAATLAPVATPMSWSVPSDEGPGPGQVVVASAADLMVTSGSETGGPTNAQAFRLSDGSPLPDPALPAFPLALSPDGTSALIASTTTLELVQVSDGSVLASTPASLPTAAALSADGTTVAIGSSGANLLAVWQPAAGPLVATCTAEQRDSGEQTMLASVSGDGSLIALDWGQQGRIVRRADGSLVSTISHDQQELFGTLTLSPDGQHLIAEFANTSSSPDFPIEVFRTSDGAQVADLGGKFSFQDDFWGSFIFLPDGQHLDASLFAPGLTSGQVLNIDLATGTASPRLALPRWTTMAGLSGDCPLILDPTTMTLQRACGGCQPRTVASDTQSGIVSLDGASFLSFDDDGEVSGTNLWNIGAHPGVVDTYPPRPEEATWKASEVPVAISANGQLAITTGDADYPCANAPGFTSRVHDLRFDADIDDLPPGITSTSADLKVVAYGPVLWCAR